MTGLDSADLRGMSEAPELGKSSQLGTTAILPSPANSMAVFPWSCEPPFGLELWQDAGITEGPQGDPALSEAVTSSSPLPFLLLGRLCSGSANGCDTSPLEEIPLSVAMAKGAKLQQHPRRWRPLQVEASCSRCCPPTT